MDSLQFDSYASSDSYHSDSSAPRTPSPPSSADPMSRYAGPYKPDADPVRIFDQDQDPDASPYWGTTASSSSHFSAGPRSSLLQELYESDGGIGSPSSPPDMYVEDQAAWSPPQQQQPRAPPHDYTLIRRATFPYVRQDHTNDLPQYPPFLHPADDMPLSAEPASLHAGEYHSPPASYSDFNDGGDPAVKIEEAHHHLLPHGAPSYMHHPMHQHHPQHPHHAPHHQQHHHQQQQQFYRPHQQMHPMGFVGGGGAHPGASLPVQHTDDAASKETQYLRRRCFNCHTTEPPSWRRSTLNPGKIVCNKCGLYERTHLRARPLRFDELRAGNKARKGGAVGAGKKGGAGGKKGGKLAPEYGATPGLVRRSSVSSTGSSAQSGSSDWDDSVSVYSNGSAPPTGSGGSSSAANSPHNSPFPPALSLHGGERDSRSPPHHPSLSPPHSASLLGAQQLGIRLPHAPDIPSLSPRPSSSHSHSHSHLSHSHSHSHMASYGGGMDGRPTSAHSHNGNGGQGHFGGGAMRTKPRSNTTGGSGLYYAAHHQQQHQHQHHHHQGGSPQLAPMMGMHSPQQHHAQQHHSPQNNHTGGSPHHSPQLGGLHHTSSSSSLRSDWAAEGGGVSVKEEPRTGVVV